MTENDRLRHAPVDAALAGDPFTEDALALRFSERHEHDLRTLPQKRNGSNGTMFAGALNPRCSPSISPVIAAAPTPRTTETGSARPVYRALRPSRRSSDLPRLTGARPQPSNSSTPMTRCSPRKTKP